MARPWSGSVSNSSKAGIRLARFTRSALSRTISTIWVAATLSWAIAEKHGQPVLPPVGLPPGQLDAIQKEILNFGHSAIQPSYHPIAVPYEVDGRTVLVISAPGGQTRPYKAKLGLGKDQKEYGYFIRKGSSTVRAKGADETELLSLAATVPFDDRLNQRSESGRPLPRVDARFSPGSWQRPCRPGRQTPAARTRSADERDRRFGGSSVPAQRRALVFQSRTVPLLSRYTN